MCYDTADRSGERRKRRECSRRGGAPPTAPPLGWRARARPGSGAGATPRRPGSTPGPEGVTGTQSLERRGGPPVANSPGPGVGAGPAPGAGVRPGAGLGGLGGARAGSGGGPASAARLTPGGAVSKAAGRATAEGEQLVGGATWNDAAASQSGADLTCCASPAPSSSWLSSWL